MNKVKLFQMDNKFLRVFPPLAIFSGVTWLLWSYKAGFLWLFPAYGFVFIWFSFFPEKELEFMLLFLATAAGFIFPRVAAFSNTTELAFLGFAETAGLWALFFVLHSAYKRRYDITLAAEAGINESDKKCKACESEVKMYLEHSSALMERIKFQEGIAAAIQKISACQSADAIKSALAEMLAVQFPGVTAGLESGAPRDSLAQWVMARKIPLLVRDSAGDNRLSSGVFQEGQRSLVVVPMTLFGTIAGFIRLVSAQPNRFAAPDLRTLELISTIVTVSMENLFMFDRVRELAIKDGLTGVYTHRAFQSRIEEEILRAARSKMPFSLIMSDIDHFKTYNDTYGHQTGDAVLRMVARTLSDNVRDIDFVARYGGEEFAVILAGVDKTQAAGVAEHFRRTIEASQFNFGGVTTKVTASFGVASCPAEASSVSQLVRAADERLYKAKHAGRNRVIYD